MDESDDGKDATRLRDFEQAREEIDGAFEWIDLARKALKRSKNHAEPEHHGEIDALHAQIGELKSRMDQKKRGYRKYQAGAKHQLRTENQEQFEYRENDE